MKPWVPASGTTEGRRSLEVWSFSGRWQVTGARPFKGMLGPWPFLCLLSMAQSPFHEELLLHTPAKTTHVCSVHHVQFTGSTQQDHRAVDLWDGKPEYTSHPPKPGILSEWRELTDTFLLYCPHAKHLMEFQSNETDSQASLEKRDTSALPSPCTRLLWLLRMPTGTAELEKAMGRHKHLSRSMQFQIQAETLVWRARLQRLVPTLGAQA